MPPRSQPSTSDVDRTLAAVQVDSAESETAVLAALQSRVSQLELQLSQSQREIAQVRHVAADSRLLVEYALNGMLLVDRHGEIVQVNSQTEKLFGYTAQEMIGQPVEMLVPESLRQQHPRFRQAYFVSPTVRPMGAGRDLYGRRRDGAQFPVEIGLNPVETDRGLMVLASVLDISQRKRAEERFRLAVESAPNAMVMVNRAGEIVLVNLQAERVFGYSREELVGQPIELLVPERFRPNHPQYRHEFFARPEARPMGVGRDLRGRRRNGSEFPVEIGLTPISTDDDVLVLSAIVDITERVQAENTSRKHLAELAHAGRLSTVGEMFSELAHEINQPLAAAANYARACVRIIRSGNDYPTGELAEWMEKAAAQAVRATEIVKRLGSFVKRSGPVQASLEINQVIRHVVSLPILDVWLAGAAQRVTPTLDLDPDLPSVSADRVQIEQVLLNLVRNAVEAMSQMPEASRRLVVLSRRRGNAVAVEVRDAGPGMSSEQLEQVFTPFYTTKPNGIGLGLSISKSIIDSHGGSFTAESQPGAGAVFCFSLPIAGNEERP